MAKKRKDAALEIKTFTGIDGNAYVVFKTPGGAFHTFVEVEAKSAGRKCGGIGDDTNAIWRSIWNKKKLPPRQDPTT